MARQSRLIQNAKISSGQAKEDDSVNYGVGPMRGRNRMAGQSVRLKDMRGINPLLEEENKEASCCN